MVYVLIYTIIKNMIFNFLAFDIGISNFLLVEGFGFKDDLDF